MSLAAKEGVALDAQPLLYGIPDHSDNKTAVTPGLASKVPRHVVGLPFIADIVAILELGGRIPLVQLATEVEAAILAPRELSTDLLERCAACLTQVTRERGRTFG